MAIESIKLLSTSPIGRELQIEAPRGPEEMAQWLRVLAALAVDQSLTPRTYVTCFITACNFSSRLSNALFWIL